MKTKKIIVATLVAALAMAPTSAFALGGISEGGAGSLTNVIRPIPDYQTQLKELTSSISQIKTSNATLVTNINGKEGTVNNLIDKAKTGELKYTTAQLNEIAEDIKDVKSLQASLIRSSTSIQESVDSLNSAIKAGDRFYILKGYYREQSELAYRQNLLISIDGRINYLTKALLQGQPGKITDWTSGIASGFSKLGPVK